MVIHFTNLYCKIKRDTKKDILCYTQFVTTVKESVSDVSLQPSKCISSTKKIKLISDVESQLTPLEKDQYL